MFERFSCTTPTQVPLQREPCLLFPISPSHPPEENDKADSIYQRSVRKDALEGAPLLQDPRSYIAGYNLGVRLSTTGRGQHMLASDSKKGASVKYFGDIEAKLEISGISSSKLTRKCYTS